MIHYSHGRYTHEGVPLDPSAPAFRYGAGFFETVCYNGTQICHLNRHLDRLLYSMRLYNVAYETVDFIDVIHELLNRNGMSDQFARINIFYPIEESNAHPVVMAVPHEHSPYKSYRLCVCNDRHVSVLNAQKTTSYMFFYLAYQKALSQGFSDAALLDFDNNLLECTTGAILLERDGEYVEMDSLPAAVHGSGDGKRGFGY